MSLARAMLACITITLAFLTLAQAQNCYYPNGDVADGDAPCSSDGGACCPFNWECMSNGLCYLPSSDYYGRYTCTDQTWQSSSCPQICTEGNTATGNEALLWCPSGDWCCDGNRSWNCCTTADTSFFSLSNPQSIAFISSVASPTPASTVSNSPPSTSNAVPVAGSSSQASSSSAQTTSASDQPTSATAASASSSQQSPSSTQQSPGSTTSLTTMTSQSLTTQTNGAVSTVTLISTAETAAAITAAGTTSHNHSNSKNKSSSSSNLGLILGLALGIPLFLLIAGIAIFALWRRRKHNAKGGKDDPSRARSPPMEANYQPLTAGTHAPEIDGSPVATVGRSKSGRQNELEGSTPTREQMARGGGGWAGANVAKKETGLQGIGEKEKVEGDGEGGPQEMWAGYIPYRTPRAELQGSTV